MNKEFNKFEDISVLDGQLMTGDNIVTHYFIDKLNYIVLQRSKNILTTKTELIIGRTDGSVSLKKVYGETKARLLKEKYDEIIKEVEKTGKFTDIGDYAFVNVDNINVITKQVSNDGKVYNIHFINGDILTRARLSMSAKTLLKNDESEYLK